MAKINGMGDLNGGDADIDITIDISSMDDGSFYFDDDLVFGLSDPVPFDKVDFFGVMVHEVGHALAIASSIFSESDLENNAVLFPMDTLIEFDGFGDPMVVGATLMEVFGGPVALAGMGDNSHFSQTLDTQTVMTPIAPNGVRDFARDLDLALLDDMGFTIRGLVLTGTAGADILEGGFFVDELSGEGGNDTLIGGFGDDILDGGSGIDVADYSGASSFVTVSLSIAGAQDTGGAGIDTLTSIEG